MAAALVLNGSAHHVMGRTGTEISQRKRSLTTGTSSHTLINVRLLIWCKACRHQIEMEFRKIV